MFGLIVLRQSPDWKSLRSIDTLNPEEFDKKVGLKPGTSRRSIELWDSTMPISYFSLRYKLKQLSLKNYRQAHFSRLDASQSRFRLSRFRILHFTDDDDLLSPTWLSMLPSPDRAIHFCRWISVRYDGNFEYRCNSSNYSYTNSYAVYPAAFSSFSFSDVYQHFDQSFHHNRLSCNLVRYVDFPLSVTHKHPASINTLRQCLEACDWDPQGLLNMVYDYVDRASSSDLPESLHWMSSWRADATKLFDRLLN